MLTSEDIISGLQKIVNDYSFIAIVWHAILYILIATLLLGWVPSNKVAGLIICLPVISVAVLAWLTGNPFNGTTFTSASLLLIIFGFRASGQPVDYSQLPYVIAGIIMILFGLLYPHFLKTDSFLKYLYASPFGLIPCPTLSLIIGAALLFNGFGSNAIMLTLSIFGLFYGIFGVLKLAVYLDIFLIFGALALLIKYIGLFMTSKL